MYALVVYESMFGNSQAVAKAVSAGLATHMRTDVVEVGQAPVSIDESVDLLVVGGPTHAFGLTRASTREDAATKTTQPVVSAGIGIREWLDALHLPSVRIAAATFDTRIMKAHVPGSAARKAEKRLHKLGARIAVPAESFAVTDTVGPLAVGELDRARAWGARLGSNVTVVPQRR
jgi:hypothetical protein